MKCRVCSQEIHHRGGNDADHHLHVWPVDPTLCSGCGIAGLELDKFLIRASGRTPMGDWTTGYLREIIENPTKHR